MKFTYTEIKKSGTKSTQYTVDKDNKVTSKILFNHDKFYEFDKWFEELEKKYNEYQANKYY